MQFTKSKHFPLQCDCQQCNATICCVVVVMLAVFVAIFRKHNTTVNGKTPTAAEDEAKDGDGDGKKAA